MQNFDSRLFKICLTFILLLFLVFCSAAAFSKDAPIRMVCFKKEAIQPLIEADKVNAAKAMTIFNMMIYLKQCAFYRGGPVQIKEILEVYIDSEGAKTLFITVEDDQNIIYYSIITSVKLKGIQV